MSLICLQYGQCGNQLGAEIYSTISDDINNDSKEYNIKNKSYNKLSEDNWFLRKNNRLQARAIIIDTEEKVVNSFKKHSSWSYNPDNIIIKNTGGSANNWAVGHNVNGPKILNKTMEALRKECEKCDRLQGFLTFNSSAGGTGSGLSSYFSQQIKNEFSNKALISVLVLPHFAGEVVTQNYNTLLTLSKLYSTCDAILALQNDNLFKMSTLHEGAKKIGMGHLNRLVAEQIGSIFQPVEFSGPSKNVTLSDLTSHLCSHPSYKILLIRTAPDVIKPNNFVSNMKWNSMEHCEYEMCFKKNFHYKQDELSKINKEMKVVANLLINRGKPSIIPTNDYKSQISLRHLYPKWIRNQSSLIYNQSRKYLKMEQYITLVTNNSFIQIDLNNILESSWQSFINNAYVYLYEKHGLTKEDFTEAFINVENVYHTYKSL